MAKGLTVTVHISGARETIKAFNRMPKDANKALRERSWELAQTLARKVANAATADNRQSGLLGPTVKPRRDRLPVIEAGGSKRVGRNRKPAYKLIFGTEFGSRHLPQFRPHRGRASYWFYETVYRSQQEIASAWGKAADDIAKSWAR